MVKRPVQTSAVIYLLPVTIILSGIIASLLLFAFMQNNHTREMKNAFHMRASFVHREVESWLTEIETTLTLLVRSMENQDFVSDEEFRALVSPLLNQNRFLGFYWYENDSPVPLYERAQQKTLLNVFSPSELHQSINNIRQNNVLSFVGEVQLNSSATPARNYAAVTIPIRQHDKSFMLMAVLNMESLRKDVFDNNFKEDVYAQLIPYTNSGKSGKFKPPSEFYSHHIYRFFDKSFLATVEPRPHFFRANPNHIAWIALGTGTLLSALVGAIIFHILGRNSQIAKQVHQRTQDLLHIQETLEMRSQDLEKAKREADKANLAKGQFLANMSHEIRTPLNSMIGMTELVLATDLTAYQRGHAQMVLSSAENLLEIINDILDFSKIEAGKLVLENTSFNLRKTVEEVGEIFAAKIRSSGQKVEIITCYDSTLPDFFLGDQVRLRQIIMNLMGNAVKFTESGFILLDIAPSKDRNLTPNYGIHLSVQDTGIGIPAHKAHDIFNKFEQADTSTTRKYGGTGLGLSICKQLAEAMQGMMGVDSKEGAGSTFWCDVVLTPDLSQSSAIKVPRMDGKKILLIDDIGAVKHAVQSALFETNALIVRATNCDEAERILAAEHVLAILIDSQIPHQDSLRYIQRWRNQLKTPIIYLSTNPTAEEARKAFFVGATGYITKPLRKAPLVECLRTLLSAPEGTVYNSFGDNNTSANPAAQIPDLSGTRVLLVEDSAFNRAFALEVLRKMHCETDFAVNGKEAVIKAQNASFDLILMDCQMPEMDGFEATQHLKAHMRAGQMKETPIVALTANVMKEDIERCKESGMDDFLGKPVRTQELCDMLAKWLVKKVAA